MQGRRLPVEVVMNAPTEETVEGKDGNHIFFRCWRPAARPTALVVICHGVNSHSGQYAWSA